MTTSAGGRRAATYTFTLRCRYPNRVGMLAMVMETIAGAGGDVGAVDIVRSSQGRMTRDITVAADDTAHGEAIAEAVRHLDGVEVISVLDRTFLLHRGGKIAVANRVPVTTRDDLAMAYTPGVARVCRAIADDPDTVFDFTARASTVGIVSDGTAVLGLGDVGALAALPVMEAKAMFLAEFAGLSGVPLCLDVDSADALVDTARAVAPVYGGINLSDVAAPRCFEVERRLGELLDVPCWHDDQWGTAIALVAGLRNALAVVGTGFADARVVIVGTGPAGYATARLLVEAGVGEVVCVDRRGILTHAEGPPNEGKAWLVAHTNPRRLSGGLARALREADAFVGVAVPDLLTVADLSPMRRDPIVMALASPTPEINPYEALASGRVAVLATGRPDFPNQISSLLAFPGVWKGALAAVARRIDLPMMLAAVDALAGAVDPEARSADYVVPSVFEDGVVDRVAAAVTAAARASGAARR